MGVSTKAKRSALSCAIGTIQGAMASRPVVDAFQTTERVQAPSEAFLRHTQRVPPSVAVDPLHPAAKRPPSGKEAMCEVCTGSAAAQLSASRVLTEAGASHPQ
jgi:hypothetical protein